MEEWLKSVKWEQTLAEVEEKVVRDTLGILEQAGVVTSPSEGWRVEEFVDTEVARLS